MSKDQVHDVLERYARAVLEKDLDTFISLYDAEVRVFDAWGRWAYEGLDAWRRVASGWFDSLQDEGVAVVPETMHVAAEGDLATLHGVLAYTAITSAGETIRSMRNRLTWILRKSGGAWKVVHEHTSVPLDFATKAMLPDAS